LLTLVGPGGSGKTRLALRTAEDLAGEFEDGVYFVPFAPVFASEHIPATIADAMRFKFYSAEDPKIQLLRYLQYKRLLLVVDNFEHLSAHAGFLSDILQEARGIKLIVTSRERLNVAEEWLLDIGGLDFPESDDVPDKYSAVQLFLRHAERLHAAFIPSDADRPYIARICRMVHGLPLGVELAASWVRLMSCQEIADAMQDNLSFLATDLRNVPERHRSMRAVFEWSWRQLSPVEQRTLAKLSVFRGGFSKRAGKSLTGVPLSVFARLRDKSLISRLSDDRCELHELLRQFAAEKLKESGDENATREIHCAYFNQWLHSLTEPLRHTQDRDLLALIVTEMDNLRAMWAWSIETERIDTLEQTWESLYFALSVLCRFGEGVALFAQFAERLALYPDDTKKQAACVIALICQSWFAFRMGQYDSAIDLLAKSKYLIEQHILQEQRIAALSPIMWGYVYHALGEYEEAKSCYFVALETTRARGEIFYMCSVYFNLGRIAYAEGSYTDARTYLLQSIQIARRLGSRWAVAHACYELGRVYEALHDFVEAKTLFEESIAAFQWYGDAWGMSASATRLGRVLIILDSHVQAGSRLYEGLNMALSVYGLPVVMEALAETVRLLVCADDFEQALELLFFVTGHPAAYQVTRDELSDYLLELQSLVSPELVAKAHARANSTDLDTLTKRLQAAYPALLRRLQTTHSPLSPGGDPLSKREIEVLRYIAEGNTNQAISERMYISIDTVKWHLKQIYGKLGVRNRVQAVASGRKLNLLP
jgi:predicted ATPase/DNA-binding CsgD family transcriptional regulator